MILVIWVHIGMHCPLQTCANLFLTLLLRGTIVKRTYGTHKNLYISTIFSVSIWFYILWPPVIVCSPVVGIKLLRS